MNNNKRMPTNGETAYHEAGHTYIYHHFGIKVLKTEIGLTGHVRGRTYPDTNCIVYIKENITDNGENLLTSTKTIMAILAGLIAEKKYKKSLGDDVVDIDIEDSIHEMKNGSQYITDVYDEAKKRCLSEMERNAFVMWLWIRTKNIINKHEIWSKIKRLATKLMEKNELNEEEIKKALEKS